MGVKLSSNGGPCDTTCYWGTPWTDWSVANNPCLYGWVQCLSLQRCLTLSHDSHNVHFKCKTQIPTLGIRRRIYLSVYFTCFRKEGSLFGSWSGGSERKLAMLARLELLHKLDARFITCQCSLMWSRMCWFSICLQLSRQKISTNDVIDVQLHVWQGTYNA